ncbi:hypothetical protein CYMTET_32479 [Cymbomonas tetramitiformis]|uniref:Uncharacterized protein n=1 Tax=Cymbomonas tetramitiformis TaxID=36881 RepID=A0AAE0FF83_9CHLO|nr:hypothetical protein CYMTET_32479 [Cymbomonas tetramitiformis]
MVTDSGNGDAGLVLSTMGAKNLSEWIEQIFPESCKFGDSTAASDFMMQRLEQARHESRQLMHPNGVRVAVAMELLHAVVPHVSHGGLRNVLRHLIAELLPAVYRLKSKPQVPGSREEVSPRPTVQIGSIFPAAGRMDGDLGGRKGSPVERSARALSVPSDLLGIRRSSSVAFPPAECDLMSAACPCGASGLSSHSPEWSWIRGCASTDDQKDTEPEPWWTQARSSEDGKMSKMALIGGLKEKMTSSWMYKGVCFFGWLKKHRDKKQKQALDWAIRNKHKTRVSQYFYLWNQLTHAEFGRAVPIAVRRLCNEQPEIVQAISNETFVAALKQPQFREMITSPALLSALKQPQFLANFVSPIFVENLEKPDFVSGISKNEFLSALKEASFIRLISSKNFLAGLRKKSFFDFLVSLDFQRAASGARGAAQGEDDEPVREPDV